MIRRNNGAYRSLRGWLKNGNPTGDPNNTPRCGARTRKGKECSGSCDAPTDAAACMEEVVRAHELKRVWRAHDEHVGSTVCTLPKPKRKPAPSVSASRRWETFSSDSDSLLPSKSAHSQRDDSAVHGVHCLFFCDLPLPSPSSCRSIAGADREDSNGAWGSLLVFLRPPPPLPLQLPLNCRSR